MISACSIRSLRIAAKRSRSATAWSATEAEAGHYLRPEKLVPINETFKTLAQKATAGKTDDLERAKALYDHVMGRMRYDKSGTGWGRGDALYACDERTGNCSYFHAYFIALTRSIEKPARFAIGATIPADKNEGTIDGYHCWAEFLADGRWVPVDISEAWKNPKLADYYFGHNPANRFELTKGRDLVVDPEPASGPINFLAYPLLEMNGEVIKPETTFIFRRIGACSTDKVPRTRSYSLLSCLYSCSYSILARKSKNRSQRDTLKSFTSYASGRAKDSFDGSCRQAAADWHIPRATFVAMALSAATSAFQHAASARAQFCPLAARIRDRPSRHAANSDRRRDVGTTETHRFVKLACCALVGCCDRNVSADGLRLLVVALGQPYGPAFLAFS